ncbi:MAG TPA: hypothetical protein DEA96_01165 [Leptospiraceae bacterium]|nr:hypothetical protein [Spirochaetaceae bacterium]HBS03543.1 hypothetical protein [Leptospiraceae bacterium]|tara:strand:- start:19833 stop:20876 length:1044 start_codon:yes stop_codon:yes gene_type:complete
MTLDLARRVVLFFTRNWKVKLGSILIASMLFFYVQWTRNVTRVFHIRVERPDIPEDLILSSRIPSFMDVQFYGPAEEMEFNASAFRITVFSPAKPIPGKNQYKAILIPDPPGQIEAKYEKDLEVTLDRSLTRELPVDPALELTASSDVGLGYVSTNPPSIKVQGPHSIVAEMDRIPTREMKINETRDIVQQKVLISELPEFVSVAPNQELEVQVRARLLSLTEKEDDKETVLEDVPVRCINDLSELNMKVLGNGTVDLRVRSEEPVNKNQFDVRVFCPAFFDPYNRSIKPTFIIHDLPIMATDKLNRPEVEILDVLPARVTLQFERIVPRQRPENEVQQGLQEHLMP